MLAQKFAVQDDSFGSTLNSRPHSAAATTDAVSSRNTNVCHTPTVTSWEHKKKPRVDEDLPVVLSLRTRCVRGDGHNRKPALLVGSGCWGTATQCALKANGCAEKMIHFSY